MTKKDLENLSDEKLSLEFASLKEEMKTLTNLDSSSAFVSNVMREINRREQASRTSETVLPDIKQWSLAGALMAVLVVISSPEISTNLPSITESESYFEDSEYASLGAILFEEEELVESWFWDL